MRSQAVEMNNITEQSVYDEIGELDTGCSHTYTLSKSNTKDGNRLQQKKPFIQMHVEKKKDSESKHEKVINPYSPAKTSNNVHQTNQSGLRLDLV